MILTEVLSRKANNKQHFQSFTTEKLSYSSCIVWRTSIYNLFIYLLIYSSQPRIYKQYCR